MQTHLSVHKAISAAVVPWRREGTHFVSLVVKLTLALVPGGVMRLLPPREVAHRDVFDKNDPTRDLAIAAENAPLLPRCDVLLRGHAYCHDAAPSVVAKLGVFRDNQPLLQKHLVAREVPASLRRVALSYASALGGPSSEGNPIGSPNPVVVDPADPARAASFGPIARYWPARKKLAPTPATAASDGFLDVPASLHWAYFQAAPADQQIAPLHGDEWLVLENLHPSAQRLETRLPGVTPLARLWLDDVEVPIAFSYDMLALSPDVDVATIIARGYVRVGPRSPSGLRALVTCAIPPSPPDWTSLVTSDASPPSRGPSGIAVGTGTVMASPGDVVEPAVPFASPSQRASALPPSSPPPQTASQRTAAPAQDFEGTIMAKDLQAGPAMPFLAAAPAQDFEGTIMAKDLPAPMSAPFAIAAPRSPATPVSAPTGTPWGGAAIAAVQQASTDFEATIGLRAAQPAPLPSQSPPASAAAGAPGTPPSAPLSVAGPPAVRADAPRPPRPRTASFSAAVAPPSAKPAPAAPSSVSKSPHELMVDRLKASGASEADLAALMARLAPPPPPPPEDD